MKRAVKLTFSIIHLEINTTPMQQRGRLKRKNVREEEVCRGQRDRGIDLLNVMKTDGGCVKVW